jgi:hypothetical protein
MLQFHCWLIFILYIACVNHFFFFLLHVGCFRNVLGNFFICLTLGYVAFVFNHWIFFALG